MSSSEVKARIKSEFKVGFLGEARRLNFDRNLASKLLENLAAIDPDEFSEGERKELAYLIYSFPFFAKLYEEGAAKLETDKEAYRSVVAALFELVKDKIKQLLKQ